MNTDSENIWAEIAKINRELDRIDIELSMNREALQSIEIDLMLFKTELDYLTEG
jgi:hypothetical protein